MNMHSWKRAAALLTVATFLTTGCMSLHEVPLAQGGQGGARPDVKAGESVVVTKKDGAKQKFTVLKVEDDALVGHNVRVSYADMNDLQVQRADGMHGNKALIIGGVLLGAAVIAAASGGGHGGGGGY